MLSSCVIRRSARYELGEGRGRIGGRPDRVQASHLSRTGHTYMHSARVQGQTKVPSTVIPHSGLSVKSVRHILCMKFDTLDSNTILIRSHAALSQPIHTESSDQESGDIQATACTILPGSHSVLEALQWHPRRLPKSIRNSIPLKVGFHDDYYNKGQDACTCSCLSLQQSSRNFF